jgi:hypothetical protein
VVRTLAVVVLVMATRAPETTAPLLSTTVPLIVPDSTCANRMLVMPNSNAKNNATK